VYGTVGGRKVNLGKWQNSVLGNIGGQLTLNSFASLYLEPCVYWYLGMNEDIISMQNGIVMKSLYSEKPFGITISGGVRFLF